MQCAQRQPVQGRPLRLSTLWDEVHDLLAVHQHTLEFLARYSLRAADAFQLAVSLACEGKPSSLHLACLDRNLTNAANREGFMMRTWGEQ